MTTAAQEKASTVVVARTQEAMGFRCLTVEELSGATGLPATLLRRRFSDPRHMLLNEVDRIARACQVSVPFLFDRL